MRIRRLHIVVTVAAVCALAGLSQPAAVRSQGDPPPETPAAATAEPASTPTALEATLTPTAAPTLPPELQPTPLPTLPPETAALPDPVEDPDVRPPLPLHDWRTPGFVAVVDGLLFDPDCRPFRAVGSNLPNLLFRPGLRANLEWMRQHGMRWMRVIATGHGQSDRPAEAAPGIVERRLGELLGEVEAFNRAHPPSESIYVLVAFTDYYEPGVPGDLYSYDHAYWCGLKVLNAPWYRRGVQRFSFDPECGGTPLVDAPNYEVHFKPWVQRLVAVGARSPALLGWQLGNEMKARNSPRQGITQAYDWYLDWTVDMVDTIRATDKNHLIFAGAQYMAELTDYPYRPRDVDAPEPLRARYDVLWDRMLRACGAYCWNVWSLTNYDFRLYAVDDALLLRQARVAAVMTEYGYTLGSPEEERQRFGGDRVAALRNGMPRAWQALDGSWHDRQWGTLELMDRTGTQGVAPWGSPAPDESPYLDLDRDRGVTWAPDEAGQWDHYRDVAANLRVGNESAGVSSACQAFRSS